VALAEEAAEPRHPRPRPRPIRALRHAGPAGHGPGRRSRGPGLRWTVRRVGPRRVNGRSARHVLRAGGRPAPKRRMCGLLLRTGSGWRGRGQHRRWVGQFETGHPSAPRRRPRDTGRAREGARRHLRPAAPTWNRRARSPTPCCSAIVTGRGAVVFKLTGPAEDGEAAAADFDPCWPHSKKRSATTPRWRSLGLLLPIRARSRSLRPPSPCPGEPTRGASGSCSPPRRCWRRQAHEVRRGPSVRRGSGLGSSSPGAPDGLATVLHTCGSGSRTSFMLRYDSST